MTKEQIQSIKDRLAVAAFCVDCGEPDLAITAIECARDLAIEFEPSTVSFNHWLEKAKDECESGRLENAVHLLNFAETEF